MQKLVLTLPPCSQCQQAGNVLEHVVLTMTRPQWKNLGRSEVPRMRAVRDVAVQERSLQPGVLSWPPPSQKKKKKNSSHSKSDQFRVHPQLDAVAGGARAAARDKEDN